MNLEQTHTQQQKQSQRLTMTQQLQQSIQMLQMTQEDLTQFLKQKALGNPLIEIKVNEPAASETSFPTNSRMYSESYNEFMDERMNRLPEKPLSLFAFIEEQVYLTMRDTSLRQIVLHLVEFLDQNGYLTISLEEAVKQIGTNKIKVLDALTLLQQLEPAGVGARNLRECLMLQTERDQYAPDLAYVILEEEFQNLADRKWEIIVQHYQTTMYEVQQVFDYIQLLSPHPGAAFTREDEQFIRPDLLVKQDQKQLIVESVKTNLPVLTFQKEYYDRMMKLKDKEVSKFMKDKYTEFDWIQKSLTQRGETIARVGAAIVERQKNYFLGKKKALNPMTLKEIAVDLNLHESTISRATNGKYLQTGSEIVELKTFFTTGLVKTAAKNQETGKVSKEFISSQTAKQQLKQLIEKENKKKPLSDQKLTDALTEKGIQISRRTVTKYRESLFIPTSSKRKRVF